MNHNYYHVEENIPLPTKLEHVRSRTKTPIAHYTYMNVGDSVLFPTYNQARSVGNLLRGEGYKVAVRTIICNQAYRVWRLA